MYRSVRDRTLVYESEEMQRKEFYSFGFLSRFGENLYI
jgi:hypothetical protein